MEFLRQLLDHFGINIGSLLVSLGAAYGTDPDRVRAILLELAGAHPDLLKDPAPEVHCTAWLDSALEFTLLARAKDFRKRWGTETTIREPAYRLFTTEGMEIPFPRRVVHMRAKT